MSDDLKALVKSLESSMADIAEGRGIASIVSAMADVIEAIKDRPGCDLGPLVAAIRAMPAPVVQVSVPAPPPAQIHVMPATAHGKWEIRRPGAYGKDDTVIGVIERVA